MDAQEADRMRAEILGDVGALLVDELAGAEWGRVLVEVMAGPDGEPAVAGVDVEEIVGDEARVDAAFAQPSPALLAALAKATEALCAIEGVVLDDVRGGTFVRHGEGGGYAFLPALVHVPSARLDRERDALVVRLAEKNELLRARFQADRTEFDVEAGALAWKAGEREVGRARATVLGTFARATRTWAWAWRHPGLPEAAQRAVSALTDAIEERDVWEISTPVFATDEPTAWALAAYVCDRSGADGVQRIARDDGVLYALVRDARESAG